jgi:hypothetical protein
MFKMLLAISLLSCLSTTAAADDILEFGSFAKSGLDGWQPKVFEGQTEYSLVVDGSVQVLRAESNAAASGLVYEKEYDPLKYPILTWRWKVDNIITRGDGRTRAGDDYAARVYVVFPHWFFPKTRTINYIWANRLETESITPNAYTGNAMMIAVESGADKVGQWVTIKRNIVEDFRKAFGQDPPRVGAIAIMTDTDNTGESAIAWYGDITALQK